MHPTRTYVRRERPGGLIVMAALMAIGMGLFVALTGPVVKENEKTAEERVVSDVTLEGESVYLVELCSTGDEADARVEAARYVPRGAAGYILEKDGEFLVIGSGYEELNQAREVSMNLSVGESIDAVVHMYSHAEARLRISSTPGQLKAFTDADALIRAASRSLRECSASLDSSVEQPPEIRARLQTELEDLESAVDALTFAAGDSPNSIVAGWLDILIKARDYFSSIAKREYKTTLYLSSDLKYAFIDIRLSHIKALNDLL